VNTSSTPEWSATRFGSPSRRNPRSNSSMRSASSLTEASNHPHRTNVGTADRLGGDGG
jgi:hypothetical protein